MVPAWLAGLRREVDLARRVEDHSAARHLDVAQHERVAVGVAVVVEHVERRRCAAADLGDVGLRDRRPVRRVVARRPRRRRWPTPDAPRPSLTVYENLMLPVNPGGGTDLHRTLIGCDGDGHLGGHRRRWRRSSARRRRGPRRWRATSTTTGWSARVRATSSRATGGSLTPSSSISGSRISPMSGFSSVSPVLLIARVLVGLVTLGAERVAPVVDPFEFGVGAGDPERAAGEVVDPDPAVDEAEPEGGRIGAGERFGLVGHAVAHAGERGRRCGDVEDAPLVDDRRQRLAGTDLVERGERRAGCGVDAAEHLATGRDRDESACSRGRLGEDRGERPPPDRWPRRSRSRRRPRAVARP